jgi:hypothetical protein
MSALAGPFTVPRPWLAELPCPRRDGASSGGAGRRGDRRARVR